MYISIVFTKHLQIASSFNVWLNKTYSSLDVNRDYLGISERLAYSTILAHSFLYNFWMFSSYKRRIPYVAGLHTYLLNYNIAMFSTKLKLQYFQYYRNISNKIL